MDVLVIGASGFVGGGIATHLAAVGHRVRGIARTETTASLLRADGITPVTGDLDARRDAVLAVAASADAVIYAAQIDPAGEADAVEDLLGVLRPRSTFVFMSGSGVFLQRTEGAWSPDSVAEDDEFVVEPLAHTRYATEQGVRHACTHGTRGDSGVRTLVLRPGLVWGPGDHGHVAQVYRSVARTGAACYVGEGLATYTHVHLDDLARLCALALEKGSPGALYHAAAGEIPNRWIAEAVAADLGCPTRSLTPREAAEVWGEFGALIMSATSRCRDPRTRTDLSWTPHHSDLLSTVGQPRLRALAAAAAAPTTAP